MSDAFLAQQNQDLDPTTVAQAMRRTDWPKWKDAMDAELESFYKLKVWEFAKLPPEANLIKCKWKGFSRQEGVDYHGTFAPTVTLNLVRVLWQLPTIDICTCIQLM